MKPSMNMGFKKRGQLIVLEALDHARTQRYHFSAVLIAGMGFFTATYDLACTRVITRLLGRIYYPIHEPFPQPGSLPLNVDAALIGTALCGTLVGHLFFGWLGDKLGRKKVYGITLILMGTFSIGSGLSFGHTPASVMTTLCFMRFWLGFGIGGGYPLSATLMSEYANTTTRGAFIAAVFAMQGMGVLTAGLVGMILAKIWNRDYPGDYPDPGPQADYLWRIMFMLGAIPAVSTFYYRMRMPETARYTALVMGDAKKAAADMTKVLQVPELQLTEITLTVNRDNKKDEEGEGANADQDNNYLLFSREFLRRHGFQLLGTTASWFLVGIVCSSQTLYQNQMFNDVGSWLPNDYTVNAVEEVFVVSKAQFFVALCSTVPGYWVTVVLVDRIGRRVIQLQGFLFMSVFLFVIANEYDHLFNGQGSNSIITFFVLYGGMFFFANFGPNTTTFIIPAEMFPARLRTTCHGISAACGKAGAILGTFGFFYASQPKHETYINTGNNSYVIPAGIGMKNTTYMVAATSILGAAFTFFLPETKSRSLEYLSGEKDFSYEVGNEVSTHPNLELVAGLNSLDGDSGTNSTSHS